DESAPPVATVHGVEISQSDVEALASDAGFLEFIGAPAADEDEDADVSQTEAGRRTLTWLIGKALIDSELAVQDLAVDEETRDQAADDLEAGDVPDDVEAIVDGDEAIGDDQRDDVADALAAYVTLDEWLRTIDPTDVELQDRIKTEHPEVADSICGSALSVDEADAGTVREQLKAGSSLDQIADDVPTLSRTPAGGECLSRGLYRRQLVDLLYGTPVGSAGEKTVVSRSTGKPVVFFATPTAQVAVEGDNLDAAVADTLQRLHDEGGAAFSELAYSTVDPDLDASWGVWDPTVGVVAADAPPAWSAFDLPDPTTTTTTAPPPPPPPPAESSEFAAGSEPTLAGTAPGDPGTGDLVGRAKAALESVVPGSWRQAVPVTLAIIEGSTSLSWTDGHIDVGTVHATGDWTRLQAVMGHEFGHQVGFRYGSQAHVGAAPTGWPPSGEVPVEEAWADCVSGSYISYYPCGGSSQPWTVDWMAAGPAGHPRTG
ncbi:MAG: hypothetical protein ACJ739_01070, partial [Acidimicrobiales bacterium]